MATDKRPGRPLMFDNVDDFSAKVEGYFRSIRRTKPKIETVVIGYEDEQKKKPITEDRPVLNDSGEPFMEVEWLEPPTMAELAVWLDCDRKTLTNYAHKDDYYPIIKRALSICEAYEAKRLDTRASNAVGTIFSLKNNFGWKDQSETVVTTGSQGSEEYDFAALPPDELATLMRLLDKAKRAPVASDE